MYDTVTVDLEIGPSGLIVPVEIGFWFTPGHPGSYWTPPDPPDHAWETYTRLDGLADHDGIEKAVDEYWNRCGEDVVNRSWEDQEPDC